jgi:hypothetical protein
VNKGIADIPVNAVLPAAMCSPLDRIRNIPKPKIWTLWESLPPRHAGITRAVVMAGEIRYVGKETGSEEISILEFTTMEYGRAKR